MPTYLAIGVSYEHFMRSNPKKLEPFLKAHRIKERQKDVDMYMMGVYVQRAVSVAVDHALNGKKATSEYFKEPILTDFFDDRPQWVKDEEMLRKAIAQEDAWVSRVTKHMESGK